MIVRRAILFAGFFILQFSGYSYAQCTSASGSMVPLYWDTSIEPDIDHYNVYRSFTSGSGYAVIGTVPQTPDPVSFADMTPPLTGYYVVTAVNTSGAESGFSNELCVQPGADDTVLVANFMNGNNAVFNSRVYLCNLSQMAGSVTVRVFTLPHAGNSALLGTRNLGILGASSARNIQLA